MIEVSIFFDEDDQYQDQPMAEYLMYYLMHHKINGASVFSAKMGFGHKHHLHKPGRIGAGDERPLMLVFIDDEIKVQSVLPHIKEVLKEGLVVLNEVTTL
ncbi:MAG TPA: DUF190 domain-containing protein [Bacteroidota bacterium]|nr:DUF190 domain-containing protein [Bacteroidota bacterium]